MSRLIATMRTILEGFVVLAPLELAVPVIRHRQLMATSEELIRAAFATEPCADEEAVA
ncbi:hypothetical protein [Microbacterium candidum]|uniref:Uncharacterized protein n=1 Tax=Microbacterium candidum TaxID=3041922 RepID=A0ABT7MV24_9MICO|nr:hypothetical protein [Microbacterium sp. ASV49]MDL9978306.1 hypothetical protein [Microbacterium sp. ASV49]